MLQTVPQLGLAKPRKIATFPCYTFLIVQVINAGQTLFLAETENALMQTDDSGLIDALQINQASGIRNMWWIGDLWAAGSIAFRPLIIIPGTTTGSGLNGALQPFGVVPTV